MFGLGVDYLIMGFAPSVVWLFAGRIIAGIMGASITTANAYIADISTPETRARNYGLINVAFGIGFMLGPSLGGIAGPAVQGIIAGTVAPHDQGKVQGALTSLMSLSAIVAPLVFTAGLFGYFTSDAAPFELPGAPLLAGSLLMAVAMLMLVRTLRVHPA